MSTDFNNTRRDAIKGIGVGALLLTTAPNQIIDIVNSAYGEGLLHKQEAKAYWGTEKLKEKFLPPGIRLCRDKALKYAYQHYKNINYNDLDRRKFLSRMGYINHTINDSYQIDKNTPFIEPAFWFMVRASRIHYEELPKNYTTELKEKNPALYYFKEGFSNYFARWIIGGYFQSNIIEDNFMRSIIIAANRPESDLEKYK